MDKPEGFIQWHRVVERNGYRMRMTLGVSRTCRRCKADDVRTFWSDYAAQPLCEDCTMKAFTSFAGPAKGETT